VSLGAPAWWVHDSEEYLILHNHSIEVVGPMDADELEDYLELQNPAIRRQIEESNDDIRARRARPAAALLAELRRAKAKPQNARPAVKVHDVGLLGPYRSSL